MQGTEHGVHDSPRVWDPEGIAPTKRADETERPQGKHFLVVALTRDREAVAAANAIFLHERAEHCPIDRQIRISTR